MVPIHCPPLSRLIGINKGHDINGELQGDYYYITWKKTSLAFPKALLDDILKNFFKTQAWYSLGASMTDPPKGGLGDYIQNHQHVWEQHSPRFASMLAAIMVHNKQIEFRRKGHEFELRKLQ